MLLNVLLEKMIITKVMVSKKIILLHWRLVPYFLHVRGKGLASRPGGHFQNAGPGFVNRVYDFILQRFEQKTKRL